MEAKSPFGDQGKKKRKQVSVTSERKRVFNREIFAPIGMAVKAGPYHGTGS